MFAKGRASPQADAPRSTCQATVVTLRDGATKDVSELACGDVLVVVEGEVIPSDGIVIEGIALVDESAVTGESAPVVRESASDRSAVIGGTRVLSSRIVVEVTRRAASR